MSKLVTYIDTGKPVGLPSCSYIYAPKGQAGEYAPAGLQSLPRLRGHACAYCYVPAVLKMKRADFDAGAKPRPDFIRQLTKDAMKYQAAGITEQVMLSFTTDPYHPGDTTLTRQTLEVLRGHGLAFCTLDQGLARRAVRDLDLFRPDRDAFASTLTSLDDAFSRKWGAWRCIARRQAGGRCRNSSMTQESSLWVSLEPTLDVESSLAIVRETHSFVDLFKVGRVNYLPMTRTTDWQELHAPHD